MLTHKSNRLIFNSGLIAAFTMALLSAGCQGLEVIDLGICGNGVIDEGEDCEPGFPNDVHTCIGKDLPNQCRISCAPDPQDPDGEALPCPSGWSCGADNVCRQPMGEFATPVRVAVPPLQWLEVGDFDGDRTDDVVVSQDGFTQVHFFEEGEPTERVDITRQSLTRPVIEDLNGDERDDLLLPTVEGLAVYRGQSDDTLLSTPFLSFDLTELEGLEPLAALNPMDRMHVVPVELLPETIYNTEGNEPAVFTDGAGKEALIFVNNRVVPELSEDFIEVGSLLPTPNARVRHIAVGELIDTPAPNPYPTDELVVVMDDTPTVATVIFPQVGIVPQTIDGRTIDLPLSDFSQNAVTQISIAAPAGGEQIVGILGLVNLNPPSPGDPTVSGLLCGTGPGATNAPADEFVDIAFRTTHGLKVAFGDGSGGFHSNICDMNGFPDSAMAALARFGDCSSDDPMEDDPHFEGAPLAVAQLDPDGIPDLVRNDGVVFSRLVGPSEGLCRIEFPHVESLEPLVWREVLIADFNHDGIQDVAGFPLSGNLDLITIDADGDGAYRNFANLGEPEQPQVHDLDGNGVQDLVFINDRSGGVDDLYVLFGESLATQGEPVLLAQIDDILTFGGGRVEDIADGVDDLFILALERDLADTENESFRLRFGSMLGRPDRQLQAPFQLNFPVSGVAGFDVSSPLFVAVGTFSEEVDANGKKVVNLAMVGNEPGEYTAADLKFGMATASGDVSLRMLTSESKEPPSDNPEDVLEAGAIVKLSGDPVDQLIGITTVNTNDEDSFITSVFTGTLGKSADDQPVMNFQQIPERLEGLRLLGLRSYEAEETNDPSDLDYVSLWASHVSPSSILCNIGDSGGQSLIMAVENLAVSDDCSSSPTQLLQLVRDGEGFSYNMSNGVLFDPGPGAMITGYACIDNDLDLNKELVVLSLDYQNDECIFEDRSAIGRLHRISTQDGVPGVPELLAEFHPTEGELEDALEALAEEAPDEDVLGFVVENLDQPGRPDRPPMSGVGSGDFNGDGIDDLLIGANNSSLLLLGKAVNP